MWQWSEGKWTVECIHCRPVCLWCQTGHYWTEPRFCSWAQPRWWYVSPLSPSQSVLKQKQYPQSLMLPSNCMQQYQVYSTISLIRSKKVTHWDNSHHHWQRMIHLCIYIIINYIYQCIDTCNLLYSLLEFPFFILCWVSVSLHVTFLFFWCGLSYKLYFVLVLVIY